MDGESQAPAEVGLLGRFEAIQKRIETDPEFSRRTLLKGMGAFSLLTALQGVAAIEILGDKERLSALAGDICPDHDIICYLREADLDVPAAYPETTTTQTTIPAETTLPPTTAVVPETTTTTPPPPPPPPPAPVSVEVRAAAIEQEPAPRRNMSYEEYANNAELFMSRLPTIETLNSIFPGTAFFQLIPEQRQHIENLRQTVQPTPEKYHGFTFDTQYSHMFPGSGPLNPRMFIWHWTGNHYDNPEHLANSMRGHASVQMYTHADGVAYQLVPDLNVVTGHARCLNEFSWGIEIYTGEYDGVHSPVFSYTPATTEASIYAAVNRLRSANLPVSRLTLLGHFAADLIFMNPYYDPYSGAFHEVPGYRQPTLHKYDPPQEFMDMVVTKAMELDQALGPR